MPLLYLCIALLGLLLFALGLAVSLARARTGVVVGCPDDPQSGLHKLVRAHGNTSEYAPALMLLFFLLSLDTQPSWVVGSAVAATLCRFLLVIGLVGFPTLSRPNPLRFLGALGTYVFGALLCIEVARQALLG